jgi:hypothetical protein
MKITAKEFAREYCNGQREWRTASLPRRIEEV